MRNHGRLALGLALAGWLCGSVARAQEGAATAEENPIEAALALSRGTGAPILAIAGSET